MLNEELSSKLRDVTWELGHIESENKQLISMNENLMEENESFQRMLEEQTASGDIFKSAVMQRSLGRKGGAQKLKSLFESSSDMSSSNGSISSRGAPPHTGVGGDQDKAVVVDEEKEEDEDSVVGTSLMEDLKALALYVSRIVSIE